MGLDAQCGCRLGGQVFAVKALLEAHELILRGALRRRLPIATLQDVAVREATLHFSAGGEDFALALGEQAAAKWARKIASPPPSLREKLGIGPDAPAYVVGVVVDPALLEALAGARVATPTGAVVGLAVVESEAELAAVLALLPPAMPMWLAQRRGRQAVFGENAVRGYMRSRGYVDHKITAVSEAFSATRYKPRG